MGEVGDLLADGLGAAFQGGFLGTALDAWPGEGPGGRCWCLHRRVVVGVGVVVLILGCGAVLYDFICAFVRKYSYEDPEETCREGKYSSSVFW